MKCCVQIWNSSLIPECTLRVINDKIKAYIKMNGMLSELFKTQHRKTRMYNVPLIV